MQINYKFQNHTLLIQALTHPSAAKLNLNAKSEYERLEFLGDNILAMVIAELLYKKYPQLSEGAMSIMHSNLVNTASIAEVARSIDIGSRMIMDYGEENMGGRSNPRNLEDTMEALIAAIYLDSNYETVQRIIAELWHELLEDEKKAKKDNKSLLQEWAHKHGKKTPVYKVEEIHGASHAPIFTISVFVEGLHKTTAIGSAKKEAESKAAGLMLQQIEAAHNK